MACELCVLKERTLKVTRNGDTRRMKFLASGAASAADMFASMQNCVAAAFDVPVERLWLGYSDEEGDLCTLTEHSIHDLACLFPEGVVRLTLKVKQHADVHARKAAYADAGTKPRANAGKALLIKYVVHVPPQFRPIALAVIQGMPAQNLHGFLAMALDLMEEATANHACGAPEPSSTTFVGQAETEALRELRILKPVELKTLLLSILQTNAEAEGGANSPSSTAAGGNLPFGDIMGMVGPLRATKGCGKGASPYSQSPEGFNPLEQIMSVFGSALAATGAGKGAGSCCGAEMARMLGRLLAVKGCAKGASPCAHSAEAVKSFEQMMSVFGPNFGSKGDGKGAGGSCDADRLQPLIQKVLAGRVPPAATSAPDGAAMKVEEPSETVRKARTAFEDSVNDLVSMGLISDRQLARELLTQHGDISTAVSVLTEADI